LRDSKFGLASDNGNFAVEFISPDSKLGKTHTAKAIQDWDSSLGFGKNAFNVAVNALVDAASAMSKALNNMVERAVKLVETYQLKMTYRLEGVGKTFDDIWDSVQVNVGNTGLLKQQAVIEAIGKAVDQGIAYNVEQRAFLETLSDNIQNTFDAFNSNLTRLIRVQQADSTA
jgi:hypothetical protein